MDIDSGMFMGSESSNSDSENQQPSDSRRNKKKTMLETNGHSSCEDAEYYQLWRSTAGGTFSVYDNLYQNPPPLPPRAVHKSLHRTNALSSLPLKLPRRHAQKLSALLRPEDCFGFEIVDVDEANLKTRTAVTKSIALLRSPRPHRPLSRPADTTGTSASIIGQSECPPTPTHRPKPLRSLPMCPASNSALASNEEPLLSCE